MGATGGDYRVADVEVRSKTEHELLIDGRPANVRVDRGLLKIGCKSLTWAAWDELKKRVEALRDEAQQK